MAAAQRPLVDVVRALERQLTSTFLGASRLEALVRPPSKATLVLRARVLEAEGTALVMRTLWEQRLEGRDA